MKLDGSTIKRECLQHGQYEANIIEHGGRKIETRCPVCLKEYEKTAIELKNKTEFPKNTGIPKRFLNCKVSDYITKSPDQERALKIIQAYLNKFDDRMKYGGSLVLCGRPGTGKTHLACAVAIQAIRMKFNALYITTYDAVMSIKETYSRSSDKTEKQVLDKLRTVDLLILDEVGVQFGTETEKILFYQIINGRYENVLPTILISNLDEKRLSEYIGERCIDRLREGGGAVIAFGWESYRK